MVRQITFIAATVGVAFLAAACGTASYGSSASSSSGGYSGASITPSGPSGPSATSTVGTRTTPLGQVLVDGSGRTLYLFAADKGMASSCYDACAGVWPPLTATGTPVAGPGVNQSLLGVTSRKDGSMEVVYNGHPLYYFISDKNAGDTTGQGLSSFGASWYALSPAGTKIVTS
jgi:predicted lipoprotein with Yx(FWY)xxD motif